MSTPTDFTPMTPAEVAQTTLLYSESELKRMASRGEIAHHRGGRGKILFFPEDVRALLRHTAVRPSNRKKSGRASDQGPEPAAELTPPTVSPFRTTSRSRAAHNERAAS